MDVYVWALIGVLWGPVFIAAMFLQRRYYRSKISRLEKALRARRRGSRYRREEKEAVELVERFLNLPGSSKKDGWQDQ